MPQTRRIWLLAVTVPIAHGNLAITFGRPCGYPPGGFGSARGLPRRTPGPGQPHLPRCGEGPARVPFPQDPVPQGSGRAGPAGSGP
jgi:hypothetical protein